MTISRGARMLALTILMALVATACGGNANDAGSNDGNATGTTSTGASTGTGSSDGGARYGGYGNGDETGATGQTGDDHGMGSGEDGPTVQANNFAFDPTEVSVESGDDLYLENGNANTPHTFTIDGTDIDVELAPLASDEVKVDLDPGTYDFHCRIHSQMTGTLTVT